MQREREPGNKDAATGTGLRTFDAMLSFAEN